MCLDVRDRPHTRGISRRAKGAPAHGFDKRRHQPHFLAVGGRGWCAWMSEDYRPPPGLPGGPKAHLNHRGERKQGVEVAG